MTDDMEHCSNGNDRIYVVVYCSVSEFLFPTNQANLSYPDIFPVLRLAQNEDQNYSCTLFPDCKKQQIMFKFNTCLK